MHTDVEVGHWCEEKCELAKEIPYFCEKSIKDGLDSAGQENQWAL